MYCHPRLAMVATQTVPAHRQQQSQIELVVPAGHDVPARRSTRCAPHRAAAMIEDPHGPEMRSGPVRRTPATRLCSAAAARRKSWATATYLISRACQSRKRIVCARQFQNSIRTRSKELIEKRIRDLELSDQFTVTNKSIVHNETLSDFLFVGLERNVESIRSLEGADIVWIEEARTISARSMEILLPTVRKLNSELIWTWNPDSQPIRSTLISAAASRRPIPHRRHVDYTDNPFFNETALPAEMALMRANNPARYRHVWLGEYDISYETKVFTNVTIGRVEVPPNTPPRYGLDFGFGTDPSFDRQALRARGHRQIYVAAEASGRSHGSAARADRLPSSAIAAI